MQAHQFQSSSRQNELDYETLHLEETFKEHSERLFTTSTDTFDIIHVPDTAQEPIFHEIKDNVPELEQILDSGQRVKAIYYIFHQKFSWGHLTVRQSTFQRILAYHNIFPQFVHTLQTFGVKSDEDENCWDGCHVHSSSTKLEVTYNVRYMEKNGRREGNPWSLRQTGVYHAVSGDAKQNIWVFLQPSATLKGQILQYIGSGCEEHTQSVLRSHLGLHYQTFAIAGLKWGEYLEDLRSQWKDLDEKACFSKVGQHRKYDYSVGFIDSQKMQLLRCQLFRITDVLQSHLSQLNTYKSLCRMWQRHDILPYTERLIDSVKLHDRKVGTIIHQSSGTQKLLSRILEYRNDEVLRDTNTAAKGNLESLRTIAEQYRKENLLLHDLAKQSQKDSSAVRTLTLIATMYLPASLVATIFSSNLLSMSETTAKGSNNGHLVVSSQIWIYCLVSLVLTAGTYMIRMCIDRKTHAAQNDLHV